jgi:tripartite-type tricarboxylate transporter receptor subunit TctC
LALENNMAKRIIRVMPALVPAIDVFASTLTLSRVHWGVRVGDVQARNNCGHGNRAKYALLFSTLALLAFPTAAVKAQSVADFYRGKSITMAVGTSPGGDYDLRMRMVARYIGRYIPGNPTIVPTNMPGAGQMLVANWLAGVAPKDGTVIVALSQNLPVSQATGASGVKYDVRQFNWIGNTTDSPNVINSWYTTGIRTIQDVMQRELVVGATGIASGSYLYPHALNSLVGTKFKIVTGYPGGNDINLAMERGEVGGRGSNSWASWKSTRPQWLAEKKIYVLVQVGVRRNPELPDIPTLQELAHNDLDAQVLTFISADTAISRPFVTNAGVPRERVEALRRAFDATMKDPDFLAEAAKTKTDISPMTGEEAQRIAAATIDAPSEVRARASTLMEGK